MDINMDLVGLFCLLLIVGVYLYCRYDFSRAQNKAAAERQKNEADERETTAVHYRQSSEVDGFARLMADQCVQDLGDRLEYVKKLSPSHEFDKESYSFKYYVEIYSEKIKYRSEQFRYDFLGNCIYFHSGEIVFAKEKINDLSFPRMQALGDALSEKTENYVMERAPLGPDEEKPSCIISRHEYPGKHMPAEVILTFVFHYSNRTFAAQKRDL